MAGEHKLLGVPLARYTIDSLITERATRHFQHIIDFGVDGCPDYPTRRVPKAVPSAGGSTCIDLFCGAGGLSEGFRQAGVQVLVGQDMDEVAGATFTATHPEAKFLGGPIQKISPDAILTAAGARPGEVDAIVGGPPCQGYSVYNHQRGEGDPRAGLFRDYLRIVAAIRPRWLVMENVTGITSIAGGAIVREIFQGMNSLGYRAEMQILRAENFGIPQERRRIVIIATRTGAPISFPNPTHGPGLLPYVTMWDAISDLPPLLNGEKVGSLPYASVPANGYQRVMRGNNTTVENHSAPRLAPVNEERMRHIPPGGSWRDIPFDLLPAGMRRAKRSDHTKRYGRPRKTDLACTILTKCDVHWGAYIHPVQDRAISVREAARLQSFPDSFVFHGSRTDQYIQVGNAVPPLLGYSIAYAIFAAADDRRETDCLAPKRNRDGPFVHSHFRQSHRRNESIGDLFDRGGE
jgi:DNA (cytosine-5)-methyltransferase 1